MSINHRRFSPADDAIIRRCLAANPNASTGAIAKHLPNRTRETIRKRLHKLGLREIRRRVTVGDPALVADNNFRKAMRKAGFVESPPIVGAPSGRARTYRPEPIRLGNCCLAD